MVIEYWKVKSKKKSNLIALIVGVGFALSLAEVILCLFGIGSTYLEKRGDGRPVDVDYQKEGPWTWEKNSFHRLKTPVYDYPRNTNRFGLSDADWVDSTSTYRVLVLGDSFTEGDGAPYDSSWVSLIRGRFNQDSIKVEILNAGVCGSDPFEQLNLYRKVLAPLKPDLIIVATSTPDFTYDGMVKGGMERFDKHGHNISLLEAAYSYSRVARLFLKVCFGYNDMLIRTREQDKIASKTKVLAEDVVSLFANEVSIPIMFVMFPYESEISSGDYDYNLDDVFSSACDQYSNVSFFSLFDCYTYRIEESGFGHKDLWWIPDDGHHRPRGYALMADCIYENIKLDVERAVNNKTTHIRKVPS